MTKHPSDKQRTELVTPMHSLPELNARFAAQSEREPEIVDAVNETFVLELLASLSFPQTMPDNESDEV